MEINIDKMAQNVTEKALDEILYQGKSIREWIQIIGSEDCMSRQAVLDKKVLVELEDGQSFYCISPEDVETLTPINPQETKTDTWSIKDVADTLAKHGVIVEQEQKWIPVSEKLPEELETVNITWVNRNPESYYADIKDKPFTATGVYFNGQWYWWSKLCTDILAEYSHNYDDIIDDDIEVIAWMPLPESYKTERSEE